MVRGGSAPEGGVSAPGGDKWSGLGVCSWGVSGLRESAPGGGVGIPACTEADPL